MCFSAPSAPPPPPLPPPPAEPAKKSDPAVKRAREDTQKRARSLAGAQSTIITGARGLLAPEQTGQTTLFGGG